MYIETPMNYTGSKYKLLEQIIPELDYTKPYFIDLFSGGGAVFTNIVDKYQKIIVNDIIEDLIGIHKGLINSDEIINQTKLLCPNKNNPEQFSLLREDYNNLPTPSKLWALMLSSTNNMMRFNQKFKYNQTFGKRSWNSNTDKKVILFTEHIREYREKIKFSSKSFNDIKISSDKIMFYCDPPYGRIKNEDGSISKKQISEAGYKQEDDINLYNYLKEIDSKGSSFLVSGVLEHNGSICWMLDKLINDGYRYKELKCNYNKVSKKGDKKTIEVVIMNY